MNDGNRPDDIHALLSNRLAVHDVVIRYATAMDTRNWELLADCFTENARLDYGTGVTWDRSGFVEHARTSLTPMPMTMHFVTNHVVEFRQSLAVSRAYVQARHQKASGQEYNVDGIYEDVLTMVNGDWRINDRRFAATWKVGALQD